MKSKLISFILALCLLISIPLSALYKYNPFTRKLDYYEPVSGSDLGDLGDVTLTGLATGNVLYYNGTAWVNLATGANTNVLTLAGGVPTWAATGAPAAHAASHEIAGADLVDHNLLTNYVANEHIDHTTITLTAAGLITGGGTIAANRTFTLTEATIETAIDSLPNLTSMQTPWTDVFVVDAGGGGDYTTIQAALNAQNAGGETFLVAPGTYTDTISFTANDQVVKPLGHAANVIVTQADANIVDGGVHTDCIIEGIEIRLTAPTTAINAIQVGTGTLILIECRGYLATAVALVQADQPALVGFTEAGTIRIKRGNYQYYHTGVAGGAALKAAFRANFNLAELHLHKIDVITITNSGTAAVTSLFITTGTAVTQMHNCIDVVVTDPNATLVVGLGYVGGSGADNIQGNHVDVIATANASYGLYHNGLGTIRSSFNAIHASDTGGTSYAFYVGASATLNSHFDDLRSDNGNSITGTFVQVSSPSDGELVISGDLTVTDIFSYDYTTDHNLLLGYLAGEDLTAGQGQYNTLLGEQAGTDITTGDNNTVVGYQAGFIETTVANATFVGYQAGYNLSGTNDNTAVGYKAMYGVAPTGYGQNVAIGSEAFTNIGEESLRNTVVGVQALEDASDEAENITAVGYRAGANLTTPASNSVLIGSFAGLGADGVADYEYNVIIGVDSGAGLTSGSWNTVVGNASAGSLTTGAYNIIIGHNSGSKLTTNNDNILIGTDIASVSTCQAHSNVIIGRTAAIELTNGYENIIIGKEAARDIKSAGLNVIIGWQASLEHETGNNNTIVGNQAGYGVAGSSNYGFNTFIGSNAGYYALTAAVRNVVIGYMAAEDLSSGTDNVVIGNMAGEGWLDTESEKLVIDVTDTATPLIYGDFSADNITINGDFNITMDAALDQVVIAQSAIDGTEDQPLIFIDDDRTGATANEVGEATILIDAEGYAALYVIDGISAFGKSVYIYATSGIEIDNQSWTMGAGQDWGTMWDTNGVGDDLVTFRLVAGGPGTTAMWYSTTALNPSAMVDHEDYLSPTFVMVNDEGADANDYAGVVIGERTQADVKVAHYFDFFAMTGAADGSVDTADELAAIFRFGPNGTGIPDKATTPGDVLFEGSIEVDGNINIDSEVFQGDYVVSQVVNFDDGSPVAICTVADGYVVTDVWIEITTTWNGNGTITIGDGATADGFLTDAGITQGAAAYYGQVHSARGAYLFAAGEEVDKIYTGADTVDATLVAGTSNQGIATVYVHITRLK